MDIIQANISPRFIDTRTNANIITHINICINLDLDLAKYRKTGSVTNAKYPAPYPFSLSDLTIANITKKERMETIDMMVAIWGKDKVADWCEITAFKYRMRMGTKPDNATEQDLKKEQWYLNKAKELRQ